MAQDAGGPCTPLLCSRKGQKPHLNGKMNGKAATQGPKGAHLSSRMLLCLGSRLLKIILQLYKTAKRHLISAFFVCVRKLTLLSNCYILERKLCAALDCIHLIF